jgi:hypothetical protein
MSFGQGPFGVVTLGIAPAEVSTVPPTTLTSSRKVDFATGRYVQDEAGGFAGMDDVVQRVTLLVAGAISRLPATVDRRTLAAVKDAVRVALAPVVDDGSARIDDVSIVQPRAGAVAASVTFTNLLTGTKQTATARLGS